ncbi:hypothetical protein V8V91_23545 [Algoriphagus halophilus]|uniref:hypothetical protein n=1 Tax=Algoriphagus halophilus TaxID=226505 RepID=UPI00358F9470
MKIKLVFAVFKDLVDYEKFNVWNRDLFRAVAISLEWIFPRGNRFVFGSRTLEIKMKFSLKELRKQTNDSTYMDHSLQLKNEETGEWETLDIEMRVRGNFRLDNCFYPPLRVKVKKNKPREPCLMETGI